MSNTSTHEEVGLELIVVSRKTLTSEIFEVEFANSLGGHLPSWEAGSHADLIFGNGFVRQYSLLRGELDRANWRFAILANIEGRGGSMFLSETLTVGTVLRAKGPRNHFALKQAKKYSFIAGGIGITPIIPMIEAAEQNGTPWALSYLGRARETMAYLSQLESKYGEKVQVFIKAESRKFDIGSYANGLDSETHTYVCGPEKLLCALEMAFTGERENTLHMERFHPKEIVLEEPNREFQVYCAKSDVELSVPADESILMAADFAGVEVTGDCMEGTCGSCETVVLEGEISHRDSIMTKEQQETSETMMICVSRARGQRIVINL